MAEAVASDVEVALPAVGADFAAAYDVVEHEASERVLGDVWDPPHPHALGHMVALDRDRDDRLAGGATTASACPPSPDVAFIDLHDARQQLAPGEHHRATQLVQPRPSRLVAAERQHVLEPSAETPCFWLTTYQIAANQLVSGRRLPWKIVRAVTDVSW